MQDISEGIYVIKGFLGVGEQGDLDIKTINIPYEARKTKLELDENNIYRFGMGFNSSQVGDGNITNVVIKSRYSLLDLKCDKMERRLRAFLQPITEIIIDEINKNNDTNYDYSDVVFDFKREIMANTLDIVQVEKTGAETKQIKLNTILNAAGQLPQDTVIEQICNVLELDLQEVQEKLSEVISTRKSINELSNEILALEESINMQGNATNTIEI